MRPGDDDLSVIFAGMLLVRECDPAHLLTRETQQLITGERKAKLKGNASRIISGGCRQNVLPET